MAGGGSNTSTSYQIPTNPTIENFMTQTVPQLQAVQQAAPLVQFTEAMARPIAGLSPLQQYAGGLVPQIAAPTAQSQYAQGVLGYNPSGGAPAEQSALGQLAQLTSGPIGSSPATQAGLEAFKSNVLPTLQNELGAMGLGRSGIAAEQIQKAATTATLPLIQQEIQNRQQAIPQYGNTAQQLAGIGQTGVQNLQTAGALGASLGGTEQQTAQAVQDAPYADWLRRQALSQSVSSLGGVPYSPSLTKVTETPSSGFFGSK